MCDYVGVARTGPDRARGPLDLSGLTRWVDLTQPLVSDATRMFGHPRVSIEPVATVAETGFNVARLALLTHSGTHVDVPRHMDDHGRALEAFPPESWIGKAVRATGRKGGGEPLRLADLSFARPPAEGDFVLIETGWSRHYDWPEYYHHPFLDEEVACWLAERRVALVGVDLPNPDRPTRCRPAGFDWPVHRILLGAGIRVVENLTALDTVVGRAAVIVAPLRLPAGDGAPARVFAAVEGVSGSSTEGELVRDRDRRGDHRRGPAAGPAAAGGAFRSQDRPA